MVLKAVGSIFARSVRVNVVVFCVVVSPRRGAFAALRLKPPSAFPLAGRWGDSTTYRIESGVVCGGRRAPSFFSVPRRYLCL